MDTMTKEQRHRCMAAIKSKDTKPEWAVRRLAFAMGFRYRLHDKRLPGKPDLVFPRLRKVIFVHGCFWHGHGYGAGRKPPATHAAFWAAKMARNKARDRRDLSALWKAGWQTLVVWECETKDPARLRTILSAFLSPSESPPLNYDLLDQDALYSLAAESRD